MSLFGRDEERVEFGSVGGGSGEPVPVEVESARGFESEPELSEVSESPVFERDIVESETVESESEPDGEGVQESEKTVKSSRTRSLPRINERVINRILAMDAVLTRDYGVRLVQVLTGSRSSSHGVLLGLLCSQRVRSHVESVVELISQVKSEQDMLVRVALLTLAFDKDKEMAQSVFKVVESVSGAQVTRSGVASKGAVAVAQVVADVDVSVLSNLIYR